MMMGGKPQETIEMMPKGFDHEGQNGALIPARILPGPAPQRLRDVAGIDANAPIDSLGNLRPQVVDPALIAGSGAGWVRLNFILGPWSHVTDTTRHQGRTWQETYRQLIAGFRAQGLQIYGLIGVEAVGDPGDEFRFPPPPGVTTHPWMERYAAVCVAILEMFAGDLDIAESFNEPNDWHRTPGTTWSQAWIDPAWFAIMLQQLYAAVKNNPITAHVQLVSGPLLGLEVNAGALGYLQDTYAAGVARFAWGRNGIPFPFDAVGYHLYVHEGKLDWPAQARAVRTTYQQLLGSIKQAIQAREQRPKPIIVSEMGWPSDGGKEEQQAQSLILGLNLLARDPWVNLTVAFCTQDFPGKYYGLYPEGSLAGAQPKPVYFALQTACAQRFVEPLDDGEGGSRPMPPGVRNQHVITAFKTVSLAHQLGNWGLMARAGLKLNALVAQRNEPYRGPDIDELPNLTPAQRDQLYELVRQMVGLPPGFAPESGWLKGRADLAMTALAFPPDLHIQLAGRHDVQARRVAQAWNRYGALLVAVADALGIDVAIGVAVLATASGRHGYGRDGRLLIRFEVPVFYARWGQAHPEAFATHFVMDPARPWRQPRCRSLPEGPTQAVHTGQASEWTALAVARQLDEPAAYAATAMGMPQLMGFNHALAGYASPPEMFHTFVASTRAQVLACFDLIAGPGQVSRAVRALQSGDLDSAAALMAGPPNAGRRALALHQAVETFRQWCPEGS